ncbi:hypothetical protein OOU_Y34scaffold00619g15 [Pyricularia oryzae Y34]|uniref:Uncharacterized protein n=3 Tax=Pyricularia oryzae TaxID=318829 RepID=A0A4P7N336_PYROR|nr:hypothetical protein OOU_Y34scaffold00619g15 [Pyricularia oryzae Y34]QBZ55411.1 hypothetical protein PoMZ_00308 [Pyricularia oryzae]
MGSRSGGYYQIIVASAARDLGVNKACKEKLFA